jgi:hypothetical protein
MVRGNKGDRENRMADDAMDKWREQMLSSELFDRERAMASSLISLSWSFGGGSSKSDVGGGPADWRDALTRRSTNRWYQSTPTVHRMD